MRVVNLVTIVPLYSHQIMRDPETGNSKGFAFINYASFEAADAALEAMNGQYLCNRAISISYAFKKESKGERHGTAAGARDVSRLHVENNISMLKYSNDNFQSVSWPLKTR